MAAKGVRSRVRSGRPDGTPNGTVPATYNRFVLDLAVTDLCFAYGKGSPAVSEASFLIEKHTHVALVGPADCGASTLLKLIAGTLRPTSGEVRIGARDITRLSPRRRPILSVTSMTDAPPRWSVRHLLIAAARQRSLDREDRRHELDLAASRWRLDTLLERRLSTLSSTEWTLAALARVELLRPAILLADRLLERANPSLLPWICDEWFRVLRIMGTTVVLAPSSPLELGLIDALIVLERGRVVQQGTPSEVFRRPATAAAAEATGEVNRIPVVVRNGAVESSIGAWQIADRAIQGRQIALARPDDFAVAAPGEESDVIVAVEEASFRGGAWHVRGMLTGGVELHVVLPRSSSIHKGRLIPLRYDPARFRLVPPDDEDLAIEKVLPSVPTLKETR